MNVAELYTVCEYNLIKTELTVAVNIDTIASAAL